MNKTRIVSLLLALVVLISCLPVISVAAASSLTLSGCWRIKSGWLQAVDDGYFSDFRVDASFYLYVDGVYHSCSSLDFDTRLDSSVLFVGSNSLSDTFQAFNNSGSHGVDGGYIYFTSPVTITDTDAIEFFRVHAEQAQLHTLSFDDRQVDHSHGYVWDAYLTFSSSSVSFECEECDWSYNYVYSGLGSLNGFTINGGFYDESGHVPIDGDVYVYPSVTQPVDPDPGTTYTSTIDIDGQAFTFSSTIEQPKVVLQVLTSGAIMSYGAQTLYYIYPGNDTFLGLGVSPTGDAVFLPGQTYSLAAGDFTFFAIGDSVGSTTVSVLIDSQTFSFSADEFPVYITVTVTESGCQLTDGERVLTYTYSGDGVFSGLTFVSGSDPVYFVGDQFSVEFRDVANSTCTLYSCFDLEGQGLAGILEVLKNLYKKFIGWIDGSISIPEIVGSLNIVDFGSVGSFFVDAYQNVTSLFGLKDLLEDPAGPFAWLIE